jgi:hypothetical protein
MSILSFDSSLSIYSTSASYCDYGGGGGDFYKLYSAYSTCSYPLIDELGATLTRLMFSKAI